jgi:hypothetical protein
MNKSPMPAEPIVVAEFWANRNGEAVRVQLKEFSGRPLLDVRKFFTDPNGKLVPTKKGLAIAIARLPDLARAIGKAVHKAQELGLIPGGGES